jgi:peptide chain release factor 1
VTVAIIDQSTSLIKVSDADLKIEWYSGTGAGGQYRNKHQNSCRITHIPTGIMSTSQCRSRQNSYNEARTDIERRVVDLQSRKLLSDVAVDRRSQVGSGMRGDKRRTYRFQDDKVEDHTTGKSARCTQILKGFFDVLWN